jgi:hypothetical protein
MPGKEVPNEAVHGNQLLRHSARGGRKERACLATQPTSCTSSRVGEIPSITLEPAVAGYVWNDLPHLFTIRLKRPQELVSHFWRVGTVPRFVEIHPSSGQPSGPVDKDRRANTFTKGPETASPKRRPFSSGHVASFDQDHLYDATVRTSLHSAEIKPWCNSFVQD